MSGQSVDRVSGVLGCSLQLFFTTLLVLGYSSQPPPYVTFGTGTAPNPAQRIAILTIPPALAAIVGFLIYRKDAAPGKLLAFAGGCLSFAMPILGSFSIGVFFVPFSMVMWLPSVRLAKDLIDRFLSMAGLYLPLLVIGLLTISYYAGVLFLVFIFAYYVVLPAALFYLVGNLLKRGLARLGGNSLLVERLGTIVLMTVVLVMVGYLLGFRLSTGRWFRV